jgi:hypothetical protein
VSKVKGNGGEREVAALIQPWWSKVEPGATFVRTPLSGGWGKTREVRAGFKASGDLMTTATQFPFTIEVKRREKWTLERLLAGKASPVWPWWKQAQTQADEMGLTPLLWIRKNRQPWRIIMPHSFALLKGLITARSRVHVWTCSPHLVADLFGEQVPAMIAAEDFLKCDPKRFLLTKW